MKGSVEKLELRLATEDCVRMAVGTLHSCVL